MMGTVANVTCGVRQFTPLSYGGVLRRPDPAVADHCLVHLDRLLRCELAHLLRPVRLQVPVAEALPEDSVFCSDVVEGRGAQRGAEQVLGAGEHLGPRQQRHLEGKLLLALLDAAERRDRRLWLGVVVASVARALTALCTGLGHQVRRRLTLALLRLLVELSLAFLLLVDVHLCVGAQADAAVVLQLLDAPPDLALVVEPAHVLLMLLLRPEACKGAVLRPQVALLLAPPPLLRLVSLEVEESPL
mmetsp:Transcript_22211/g.44720  ORF Transcript_22211/g.44720 Transcript_22211/m.44720 type:complete len:245 (-) Transcript_22211:71-805(-)